MGMEKIIGLTPDELDWAYSIGVKYGGKGKAGGLGNKGDAARHIALGYLAALADERRGYASDWSKTLVQLKEYYQQAGTKRNVDSPMDRYNNSIGFELQTMVGDDKQAFEGLLDDAMQSATFVESIDDMPEYRYKNLKPVYIRSGYQTYRGGPKAD